MLGQEEEKHDVCVCNLWSHKVPVGLFFVESFEAFKQGVAAELGLPPTKTLY